MGNKAKECAGRDILCVMFSINGCELRATSYELQATSCELLATSCKLFGFGFGVGVWPHPGEGMRPAH